MVGPPSARVRQLVASTDRSPHTLQPENVTAAHEPFRIRVAALLERRQAITRRCERAQARIIAQVFHRYGRRIKSLRRAWKTACREAGRPWLLLHDLRRSAVRNLERAGISRSVAMKLTGRCSGFAAFISRATLTLWVRFARVNTLYYTSEARLWAHEGS
jgi:integrase